MNLKDFYTMLSVIFGTWICIKKHELLSDSKSVKILYVKFCVECGLKPGQNVSGFSV